jgi:hypothetical protein
MAIYVETKGKMECTSPDRTVHDLLKVAAATGRVTEETVQVPVSVTEQEVAIISTSACIKDTLKQLKEPKEVK